MRLFSAWGDTGPAGRGCEQRGKLTGKGPEINKDRRGLRVLIHLRKGRKSMQFYLFMRDTDVQFSFCISFGIRLIPASSYELESVSNICFICSPFQKRLYRVGVNSLCIWLNSAMKSSRPGDFLFEELKFLWVLLLYLVTRLFKLSLSFGWHLIVWAFMYVCTITYNIILVSDCNIIWYLYKLWHYHNTCHYTELQIPCMMITC